MSYDNACKYLAEKYPAVFVRWLLGIEAKNIRILKTELNVDPIYVDSLLLLRIGRQILHLEFQTKPVSNPPLPLRMLDYSVRLKRKYRCAVTQVLIFLETTNSPVVFTEEYRDETTIHQYRVMRIWEQEPSLFLNTPALLPFAPLTKSNSPTELLAQVAAQVNQIDDSEQLKGITACTEILAGLRFDNNLIRSLFREDIMRESTVYQSILEEGKQAGLREGREEARQQGRQEEALRIVMVILRRKFGELESRLSARINQLSLQQLEELTADILDFTEIEDLDAWLGYPRE